MAEAQVEDGAPHAQPFHLGCLDADLFKINDKLSVARILLRDRLTLSSGWIRDKDLVLDKTLLSSTLGGNMNVDPEAVVVVAKLVDGHRVLVDDVDLSGHAVVCLDEVPDELCLDCPLSAGLLRGRMGQDDQAGHTQNREKETHLLCRRFFEFSLEMKFKS
jgi:hypothetical protein